MLGASCVERVSHCASARLVPVERGTVGGHLPAPARADAGGAGQIHLTRDEFTPDP